MPHPAGRSARPWQALHRRSPAASGRRAERGLVPGVAASSAPSVAPSASPAAAAAAWTFVGKKACPESRFECITLAVPKDHTAAAGGPTWDVTFAIQRAAKTKLGTFVVITGGPGTSGVASADGYTDYYAEAITDAYDIVFVDQRGIGLSGRSSASTQPPRSTDRPRRPQVAAERDAAAAAAKTFATDCITEVRHRRRPTSRSMRRHRRSRTSRPIRDYLEVDTIHLYGESYGTQLVQTTPRRIPSTSPRCSSTGRWIWPSTASTTTSRPRDRPMTRWSRSSTPAPRTRPAPPTSRAATRWPPTTPWPRSSPTAAIRSTSRTRTGPRSADVRGDGPRERRVLIHLQPDGPRRPPACHRLGVNGNIVAARPGRLRQHRGRPGHAEGGGGPTWSDAMYYAVECQDYTFFPDAGDADARFDAWVEAAHDGRHRRRPAGHRFFGDTPCL